MISVEWERLIPGTDVALERVAYFVRDDGFVEVDEAVLAQLLLDAGWERAS